jgi:hypothetical protein
MKSDGGTFLLNLAGQAAFLGAMLSPLGSIGGTLSNIVSIGASLYSAGSSVKNLAEFTSEGSTKTYARYDFSADFSMMKSSRHAGMAFEGAANESNGDPKKKDPKSVTIYSPSDNLKTSTTEFEHKFLSSLYYQEPQGPSAWERYKQDEISIPQLISEWENSFDQTMMEFWQVGAYMLPSTGLSVAISGQDLLGNDVGVGMRVFSGVTSVSGFGFGVRSIAVRASITTNTSKGVRLADDVAKTFQFGRYAEVTLDKSMVLSRYYDNVNAFAKGRFMTNSTSSFAFVDRMGLALKPSWNGMTKVAHFEIPAGSTIYKGRAAMQFPWFGGKTQYFVPELGNIKRVIR